MAILLRGRTVCKLCGRVIGAGEPATLFPHLVLNEADPLYPLSDAACHTACVETDRRGLAVAGVAEAAGARIGPGRRSCAVCNEQILDPDDYVLLGYLGDPATDDWRGQVPAS